MRFRAFPTRDEKFWNAPDRPPSGQRSGSVVFATATWSRYSSMPSGDLFHVKQRLPEALEQYAALVRRYHQTLDLMSARALEDLEGQIEDGLEYARVISDLSPPASPVLDLGSGVGLPGIPIAASLPSYSVALVERRRRRAAFLRIALSQLSLDNAELFSEDVRSLSAPCVGVVVSQAVGSLADVYSLTRRLHGERVLLVSRKSRTWREELLGLEAEAEAAVDEVEERELPARGRLVAVSIAGGSACPQSG